MSRHRLIISRAFRKAGKGASGTPSSSPRGCLSPPPFSRLLFSVSSGLGVGWRCAAASCTGSRGRPGRDPRARPRPQGRAPRRGTVTRRQPRTEPRAEPRAVGTRVPPAFASPAGRRVRLSPGLSPLDSAFMSPVCSTTSRGQQVPPGTRRSRPQRPGPRPDAAPGPAVLPLGRPRCPAGWEAGAREAQPTPHKCKVRAPSPGGGARGRFRVTASPPSPRPDPRDSPSPFLSPLSLC